MDSRKLVRLLLEYNNHSEKDNYSLSLDGLPFPSESFDFVRISELGLAIPEDEWQHTLGV